jgi:hypothetical protein
MVGGDLMDIDKLQIIESICRNGKTETIGVILRTPSSIANRCAGDFIASCGFIELAKITQFIIKKDGTVERRW